MVERGMMLMEIVEIIMECTSDYHKYLKKYFFHLFQSLYFTYSLFNNSFKP